MIVSRDDFEIRDEQTVVHRPSGMIVSTYRYKDPGDIGDLTVRNASPEADKLDPDEVHAIRAAALELLRELQTKP